MELPTPNVPTSSPPETGPGSRRRRLWFLGVSGMLVLAGLVAFRGVLMPFLLAVVVAYVLSPLVSAGERLHIGKGHPPRWVVVLVVYSALIGIIGLLISLSVPRLAAEFSRLAREAPRAVATVRNEWLPTLEQRLRAATEPYLEPTELAEQERTLAAEEQEAAAADAVTAAADPEPTAGIQVRPRSGGGYDIILPPEGVRIVEEGDRAFRIETAHTEVEAKGDLTSAITHAAARAMENTEQTAVAVLQAAQKLIAALTRGIFGFVMLLMISAYLLITSDRIFTFLRSLYAPGRRDQFDELVQRIDRGLAGVVRGQLLICCVNGVLSGIGFYLFGLKYWTFLTLLAAVMSIIPIFGSILSTVPAVLVALPEGIGLALLVLGWIVLIHQIEANFLNPKIMGDAARVHPVLVVFALLAGEHAAGIIGALLAVPVLSITQTLFLYLRERFLGVPRATSIPPPAAPASNPAPDPRSLTPAKESSSS